MTSIRKLLWTLAFLFVAISAFAQPNNFQTVRQVYDTGHFNLSTPLGTGEFTDAVVCALNQVDPNWGHLRKNPGQTQLHGHAEDAALYRVEGGLSIAVDFIGGSGGPNPQPGWIADSPRYTADFWFPPHNCGAAPEPTPQPAPVVDLSAVLAKLDALSNQIHALSLQIADVGENAEQAKAVAQSARDRIEDTLQAVDLARQQINRPPIYTGGIFGIPVTLRPTVHPANPIQ